MSGAFDRLADLPLAVTDCRLERRVAATSAGFERATTVVEVAGPDGRVGRGEDVTYETDHHDAWLDAGPPDVAGALEAAGAATLGEASAALDGLADDALWPDDPERETFRHYRRWSIESAALDLALRQSAARGGPGTLAAALDRDAAPVRFVVSTRLRPADSDAPPTAERVREWLDLDPGLEFKLDPETEWDGALVEELAATDAVRILDLKAHYEGTTVDGPTDPAFYRRLAEAFPEAVLEDPAVTDATEPVLAEHRDRLSWDAPVHGVADLEALPFEPRWCNVKPSRFGTLESLLEALEWCDERDVTLYGGGQYELGPGRGQLHDLASVFYPEGPNDTAPRPYNEPEPRGGLPASPLAVPEGRVGFGW